MAGFRIFLFRAEDNVRHDGPPVMFDKGADGLHPVAESHFLGGEVGVADDGVQFVEVQRVEPVFPAGFCCFDGVSLVPVFTGQQVSDFRDQPVLVFLHRDAALPDHLPGVFEEHAP